VVRYVHLPAAAVDTALLEDATRRGMCGSVCGVRVEFSLGGGVGGRFSWLIWGLWGAEAAQQPAKGR